MPTNSIKNVKIVADKMLDIGQYLPAISGVEFNIAEFDGRDISAEKLAQCDALLVRSITNVNECLLSKSSLNFVGSATIGRDHIDLEFLKKNNVRFSYAPGCNANAVVDYVMATLLSHYGSRQLRKKQLGIVGFGNVGKRLAACCQHFSIPVKVYDPLVDVPEEISTADFSHILQSDAISLHVPLTHNREYSTYHLFSDKQLSALNTDALLINTSRGAVVDNTALKKIMNAQRDLAVTLDVWEHEPEIDKALVTLCNYSTGHIAGYSEQGKERGVKTIVNDLLAHLNANNNKIHVPVLERAELSESARKLSDYSSLEAYAVELSSVMNISSETRLFKMLLNANGCSKDSIADHFDHYRKSYTLRAEFDYSYMIG